MIVMLQSRNLELSYFQLLACLAQCESARGAARAVPTGALKEHCQCAGRGGEQQGGEDLLRAGDVL